MTSPIPIQNLYYLLCYAWEKFPEGKAIDVGTTESPEVVDLFAFVLSNGLRRLIRRGLDRGYVEVGEELISVRGRIALQETIRRNLLSSARVSCRYDELQHDVLHNQIIKATVSCLADAENLSPDLAHELRGLSGFLRNVTNIRLLPHLFRRVQLSRNVRHYDFLLKLCELIHDCLLPQEGGAKSKFADILKDEARMSAIFENFVRNFYRMEQREFQVGSEVIIWAAEATNPLHLAYLPSMRTDVSLRSADRTIILDTKYYSQTLARYMGTEKIWSGHLYQLFAYLKNSEHRGGPDRVAEGILLYPAVGQPLDLEYLFGDHVVRVKTINLDAHWTTIRQQLLEILRRS